MKNIPSLNKLLKSKGFPTDLPTDGNFHRFDRNGSDNGYFSFDGTRATFGDWKTGETYFWHKCKDGGGPGDPVLIEEESKLYQMALADRKKMALDNAEKFEEEFNKLPDAGEHEYFTKKKVAGFGVKINNRGSLIIPMRDLSGKLWSYQWIDGAGKKGFAKGGSIKGKFHTIGEINDSTKEIVLAEGYATAYSIWEATKKPVLCVFSASNLVTVAKTLAEKKPHGEAIYTFAADNDAWTTKGDEPFNPGIQFAQKASKALPGSKVVIPQFKDKTTKPTDFNDLYCLEGIEEVKKQIAGCEEIRTLPDIIINKRQLRDVVKDAWNAVFIYNQPEPKIFKRYDHLVVTTMSDDETMSISTITGEEIYEVMTNAASWYRKDKNEQLVPGKPDRDAGKVLITRPHILLPELRSVVDSPVFGSTGVLIDRPGYFPQEKILFHPNNSISLSSLPGKPSRIEIEEAKKMILDDLLGDFPFLEPSDIAHIVASLIALVMRRMISGPTPLYLIEAPSPGTGKSLLAAVIGTIVTGKPLAARTFPTDESERRKRITSELSIGPRAILLDNADNCKLDSSTLASVLTNTTWRDRILGVTRMASFPNEAGWFMTANNPKLSTELVRRCIRVRLDPKIDQPWKRAKEDFKHPNILSWAKEHRADLLRAVLLLVQGWIAKGKPAFSSSTLGSFENYCEIVGGVLQAAEIPGFLENLDQFYEDADSDGQEWREFVGAWWEQFGVTPVSAQDLYKFCVSNSFMGSVRFRGSGSGSEQSQVTCLGKELSGARDRVFDDLKLVRIKKGGHHGNCYYLSPIPGSGIEEHKGKPSPTSHEAPIDVRY